MIQSFSFQKEKDRGYAGGGAGVEADEADEADVADALACCSRRDLVAICKMHKGVSLGAKEPQQVVGSRDLLCTSSA